MKLIDKTPYQDEKGVITPANRLQATFKLGLDWYPRVQGQARLLPIMDSQFGRNFILMRNVTLGGTNIELPLILIGPPGIFLINTINEKGIFRAKEEEWGTISGDRFVPAKRNQLALTARMGKVLQTYLDRAGFKGMLTVDAILMATDPGTHIESVRPIVRTVMLDALERFCISMTQASPILSPEVGARIAQVILTGKGITSEAASAGPIEFTPVYTPSDEPADENAGSLDFTFTDDSEQPPAEGQPAVATPKKPAKPGKRPARKKQKMIGGVPQIWVFAYIGLFVVWLCAMIGSLIYIFNG